MSTEPGDAQPEPTTPAAQPRRASSEDEPQPDPIDPDTLPLGAEHALPALHRAELTTLATLTTERATVVVYSFNRLEEFLGTRAPELRTSLQEAIAQLHAECEAERAAAPQTEPDPSGSDEDENEDEDEDGPISEPSCSAVAAANATGLTDGDIDCEVMALASFDQAGALTGQATLLDQGCIDGAVRAQLGDLTGHGKVELAVLADLSRSGPTPSGFGPQARRQRLLGYHLEFRKEPFVPFLEVDLLERGPGETAPPDVQRRVRVSPRWLDVVSKTHDGGCAPEDEDEDEDEGEGDRDDDACHPFDAQRLRWDHFEGRYVDGKPLALDAEEIERNLEQLPPMPRCAGACDAPLADQPDPPR